MLTRRAGQLLSTVLIAGCAAPPVLERPRPVPKATRAIHFCLREGVGHNCLLRDDRVAAHVLATSGRRARLVVAFPADNSGAALWGAAPDGAEVQLGLEEPLESFSEGELSGVRFRLHSSTSLELEKVILGSVRLIRDYHQERRLALLERVLAEHSRRYAELPPELQQRLTALGAAPEELDRRSRLLRARPPLELHRAGRGLVAESTSLDGRRRYRLRLELEGGAVEERGAGLLLRGGEGGLRLRVEAACSAPPLRGLGPEELLRPSALEHLRRLRARPELQARWQPLDAALRSLAFLSTDRKFLAGSWRFLTYFGRDTLMSLWLLRPALAPAAVESGLQSVLDRLSPEGEVAHEESLGDQAVLERLERWDRLIAGGRTVELAADLGPLGRPVYDYKMVDDDFMLAPLFAEYLGDELLTPSRLRAFLARRGASGRSNLEALAQNLAFVLRAAAPYAESGRPADLVRLKDALSVGDWRDSEEGLGGGRYPSSVNAYLVPAALRAARRILESGKLDRAVLERAVKLAARGPLEGPLVALLDRFAGRWSGARRHFEVKLSPGDLRERLGAFLRGGAPPEERALLAGVEVAPGLTAAAIAAGAPIPGGPPSFDALSLEGDGSPVEVMNTDDGFALLADEMPFEELSRRLRKYELRYPLGLDDRFGVYVASPALSGRPADWSTFDRGHYHGTVVWSWQLGLLERGLMRQLERCRPGRSSDQAALAARLRALLERVARAEERVGPMRSSELWTVEVRGGRFEPVAYGHGEGHATEANTLQLWSDIGIAVDLERTRLGLLPAPSRAPAPHGRAMSDE